MPEDSGSFVVTQGGVIHLRLTKLGKAIAGGFCALLLTLGGWTLKKAHANSRGISTVLKRTDHLIEREQALEKSIKELDQRVAALEKSAVLAAAIAELCEGSPTPACLKLLGAS